ncbi:MAG: RNA polymerase sigma factor [Candidatus Kapaibacteriota bacterium]
MKDYLLIEKIILGDTNAFSILINRYKNQAYNIAFRILNNREDAEESASDAFLKVYHNLKDFDKNSSFSTWLYSIVYNNSISIRRKKKDTLDLMDNIKLDDENLGEFEISEDIADSFEDNLTIEKEKSNQLEKLKLAILKLKELEQVIITLYYIEDKSTDEIANITGKSVSNVKIILFRARKVLYNLMKEDKLV